MTQYYSVNFSRLQQISILASAGYEIVLYRGQSPIKEKQNELCCSAGFSGHKKNGDDPTTFLQVIWKRGVLGCSTNSFVQRPGKSINIKLNCLSKGFIY